MTHKERVLRALNHEETDRPPFQATFTPEFADRLRREFHLPEQRTEPHHRTWYGYDLEILTGQDALQAGGGWVTNYYLKPENYTDEWGVEWKIDPYETPFGTGHYTNIARNRCVTTTTLPWPTRRRTHSARSFTATWNGWSANTARSTTSSGVYTAPCSRRRGLCADWTPL